MMHLDRRSTPLLRVAAATVVCLAIVAPGPSAVSIASPAHSAPRDCFQATPAEFSLERSLVRADVLVFADRVSVDAARTVMEQAARAYADLGIELRSEIRAETFVGDTSEALHAEAKQRLGGTRPSGVAAVLVISRQLQGASSADCIGGIRFPENGFATSRYVEGSDRNAIIAAHELGHVFGAHHHYANCAEGLSVENGTWCTVMLPVYATALRFSALNGAIVRGHAERFAAP